MRFSDDFSVDNLATDYIQSDSTGWTIDTGVGNAVHPTGRLGSDEAALLHNVPSGTIDQFIRYEIAEFPAEAALRHNGTSARDGHHYRLIVRTNGTVIWEIHDNTLGGYVDEAARQASMAPSWAVGDVVGLLIKGTGAGTTVEVWQNPGGDPLDPSTWGASLGTLTHGAGVFFDTEKYIGLSAPNLTLGRWANLFLGDEVSVPGGEIHTVNFSGNLTYTGANPDGGGPVEGVKFTKDGVDSLEVRHSTDMANPNNQIQYEVDWATPVLAGEVVRFIYDKATGAYEDAFARPLEDQDLLMVNCSGGFMPSFKAIDMQGYDVGFAFTPPYLTQIADTPVNGFYTYDRPSASYRDLTCVADAGASFGKCMRGVYLQNDTNTGAFQTYTWQSGNQNAPLCEGRTYQYQWKVKFPANFDFTAPGVDLKWLRFFLAGARVTEVKIKGTSFANAYFFHSPDYAFTLPPPYNDVEFAMGSAGNCLFPDVWQTFTFETVSSVDPLIGRFRMWGTIDAPYDRQVLLGDSFVSKPDLLITNDDVLNRAGGTLRHIDFWNNNCPQTQESFIDDVLMTDDDNPIPFDQGVPLIWHKDF